MEIIKINLFLKRKVGVTECLRSLNPIKAIARSIYLFIYFIYNCSSSMNYFIYTSHHVTPLGRNEVNKLTSLPKCGFIAQLAEHRTGIAEVTGSNPVEALIFFRLLLSSCLNWKLTAMIILYFHLQPQFKYELFHIYFTSWESNTYHRPKPDRQPMTYYTTHHSVLCVANIIGLNQMSHAA